MSAVLTSLAEYERSLPDGWRSFSECTAKAVLLRNATAALERLQVELPAPLQELLESPPPVTAWIPEAVHVGMLLAAHDAHASRPGMSTSTFLAWAAEQNRQLLTTATYAPLTRGRVERFLKSIPAGWERFHRGAELVVEIVGERDAVVVLRAPVGLYPSIASQVHAVSFRVALEVAGAIEPQSRHVLRRPGVSEFLLSWTDEE